ncbi:polysaccharide pyruvyl transferase CsaB [Deinococcus reticulitermitis]|uniref:Polysaccharide pyruvyl transferase CsaB n=1 Tax=Deinococcus reticulitermitis TaxID=856736 RepID=A0A1H6YL57_9DEIO|nr:polysaccharide pyruvyl transferase CsaB [Deinococcus reticulitermitis]SEJ39677.1 polysaccharide pyruvyl transferase CsaB [Deinococcus reticulitermitis]
MRAVISGYYGYGNTGDEAIALAITRELKRLGIKPVLLSITPEESARLYGCEAVARLKPLDLTRAVAGSGMLISGGGGLLQDRTSARNLTYYLGLIRLARLMGKPVVVFNQSVGPLSPEGGARVRRALGGGRAGSVRVIVRDRGSLDTLARLGISARLGGDPALLLEPSPRLGRDAGSVVIAPRGDVAAPLPALREVTEKLRAQGRRVTALSFMPEHDDAAAHGLGADQVISTRDPQVALDTIAASGYVIGVRLHAVILAAAARVPFAGVAYDPKVQGFCDDLQAQVHPVTPDPVLLARHAEGRTQPNWAAVGEMRRRAAQSFHWLRDWNADEGATD